VAADVKKKMVLSDGRIYTEKEYREKVLDVCIGCGKKIEGHDRWTSREKIMDKEGKYRGFGRIRFAHWKCIEEGKCKWTPYNCV